MSTVLTDAVDRSVGAEAARLKGEKRTGLRVHARAGLPCPVCGDVIAEVYGLKAARRAILVGFGTALMAFATFLIVIQLPSASFYENQAAFESVVWSGVQIVAASLIAYVVGQFLNSYVLVRMKARSAEPGLWRRLAGSTGVGYGVAVPHARIKGLSRMRAVFIRLEHPIDFDAVDDQPVDLIFALFAHPNAGSEHLRALARVSRLLRQSELREQLRKARTADAIHALLAQEAASPRITAA
jgi:mannitol/fructose-specific phosphotransferase system IIA component